MKALFLELRIFRYLTILLCLVWMAVAPLMPVHIPMQPSVINGSSGGNPALLQFSAAGHVLGFQASGVTIASTGHALRIEFIEANRSEPVASKPAGGRNAAAGFAGSQGDLSASMPGAPPLNQVTWYNLWDGISLTYQVVSGGIAESVYTLEPGAAVDAIRLRYNAPVRLNGDGSLSTIIAQGQMIETAPIAWQQIDGRRIPVQISYRLFPGSGSSTALVGFSASGVDEAYPLTIDPQLRWVVSLGGSEPADNDQAKSIAVDASGNVYLAGFSQIPWGSSPLRAFTYDYDFDAFVVKLDASGVSQWNTFLGGIGDDRAVGIAVDGSGNILVVGQSDESWGSPVRAYGGAEDVWVARLDSSGNLSWNTFLGSTFTDDGYGIAVNTSGDAFVAGYSTSSWGSPVTPFGGGGDAFVAELAGATGDLVWSTFVGGTATDYGKAIVATDTTVYLTGSSKATWGASPKRVYSAGEDAFVASLDAATGDLGWNTFLGGDGDEGATAVTLDASGNIYIAGNGNATWGTPVHDITTAPESFAARLDATGQLVWHTFLGGEGSDFASGISADSSGYVYISGYTSLAGWGAPILPFSGSSAGYVAQLNAVSGGLGWNTFLNGSWGNAEVFAIAVVGNDAFIAGSTESTWGSPIHALSGSPDAYAAELSLSGSLTWNTFMGGADDDNVTGVTVDGSGNVYVVGYSNRSWGSNPVNPYAWQNDAFVACLDADGVLIWNTFLGSAQIDNGYSIAYRSGSVYVAGSSTATWGSPVRDFSGSSDTFVARLDATTGAVQWNTFLGGTGGDYGYGVQADASSNIYVVGLSSATWGTPSRPFSGGSDAFVVRLNSSGELVWNTFLGGTSSDGGYGIGLDISSNVYASGYSNGSWGDPTRSYTAGRDAFVARLDNASGDLVWNTFLGGSGADVGKTIAIDWDGNILIAGDTSADWGPTDNQIIDGVSGLPDAYVANVNAATGELVWKTIVGSGGSDYGAGINVDIKYKKIYLAGDTNTGWVGVNSNSWQASVSGQSGFVAQFSANGSMVWTIFIEGQGAGYGMDVAVDPNGVVYTVGYNHPEQSYEGWQGYLGKINTSPWVYLPMVRK